MSVTHILWREDGPEFVDLEQGGIDPDNSDLEPIPEGLDTDFVSFDAAARTIEADPAAAQVAALHRVDQRQEQAVGNLARLAIAVADLWTWGELQDLKTVTDLKITTMSVLERRIRWPFVIALMTASGTPLTGFRDFADIAEAELAGRIAALANISAKALLARRAVRQAATVAEKLAAAEVDFEQ